MLDMFSCKSRCKARYVDLLVFLYREEEPGLSQIETHNGLMKCTKVVTLCSKHMHGTL